MLNNHSSHCSIQAVNCSIYDDFTTSAVRQREDPNDSTQNTVLEANISTSNDEKAKNLSSSTKLSSCIAITFPEAATGKA